MLRNLTNINNEGKKCHTHLVSFIKHHGLFVPYIVDIFDCKKCPVHLVSFIKHRGLFVPYIVDIFIFLIRKSWLSPSYIHSPSPRFSFFLLTRKSWLSLHPRHWIQEYLFHKYSIQVRSGIVKTTCMSNKSLYLIEFYFYWRVKIVIILMHFTIINHLPSQAMPTHMERTTVLVRSCRIIIIITSFERMK